MNNLGLVFIKKFLSTNINKQKNENHETKIIFSNPDRVDYGNKLW